ARLRFPHCAADFPRPPRGDCGSEEFSGPRPGLPHPGFPVPPGTRPSTGCQAALDSLCTASPHACRQPRAEMDLGGPYTPGPGYPSRNSHQCPVIWLLPGSSNKCCFQAHRDFASFAITLHIWSNIPDAAPTDRNSFEHLERKA
ncbi:hypothetical protein LEMLEM_LOCUS19610, partial [Lemmus lemmus]